MIKITVNNKEIIFNLKNRDREKGLYNTWYSMEDMPKYRDKRLKFTTDKNETSIYRIRDIQKCEFIDEQYMPEDQKSNSVEYYEDMTVEELFDKFFKISSDIGDELKKVFCDNFRSVPKAYLKKLFDFSSQVNKRGHTLDSKNPVTTRILLELIHDPSDDATKYVDLYIEYLNAGKLC